jgi:hypothetical protein
LTQVLEQQSALELQACNVGRQASSSKSTFTFASPLRRMLNITSAGAPEASSTVTRSEIQPGVQRGPEHGLGGTLAHGALKAPAEKFTKPVGNLFMESSVLWPGWTSKSEMTVRLPSAVTRTHCTSAGASASAMFAEPVSSASSPPPAEQATTATKPDKQTAKLHRRCFDDIETFLRTNSEREPSLTTHFASAASFSFVGGSVLGLREATKPSNPPVGRRQL